MRLDRCAISLAVLLATACGGDGVTPPPITPVIVPSRVQLTSDVGDYIGLGGSYAYTRSDAVVTVQASGNSVTVQVSGDQHWSAHFVEPNSLTTLKAGTYGGLHRWPFHDPAIGGIDWSGEGRGCNSIDGYFTIDSVTYTGGALSALDLRFEQHCEGATPALRGTIHWTTADASTTLGPSPIPGSLWQPPAGALKTTGTSVYLASDAGDYIGGGVPYSYATPSNPISVSSSGRHLSVSVGGWIGDFEGMSSLTQLKPGYYPGLQRFPFGNPAKGSMDWFGNGRGCNTLTGWFAIDGITYSGTTVTTLDLRFEQHCEGGGPALRGAIRFAG